MFKKFCAGIFVSGSMLSSTVGSSAVVAAPPPVEVGYEISNGSDTFFVSSPDVELGDYVVTQVVQCGTEVLRGLSRQQISYFDELSHNVRYILFCNPKVLSKINDEQVAHLKGLGNDWRAASDYIRSLEDAGHRSASGFFGKVWDWLVG